MSEVVGMSPVWQQAQYFDNAGLPLNAGKIWTYNADATSEQATYTDYTGNVANANPIVLDSSGRIDTGIWLSAGPYYTFVLTDSNDVELARISNVSVARLFAGPNITLTPANGIGNTIIEAAGPGPNPTSTHGQSYMAWMQDNTLSPVTCDGLPFNNFSAIMKVPPVPPVGGPDLALQPKGVIGFTKAGAYQIIASCKLTPQSGLNWPQSVTMFGSTCGIIGGSSFGPFQTSTQHTRYSDYDGDGLTLDEQSTSWVDIYNVSVAQGDQIQFSLVVNSPNQPDFLLDTTVSLTITRFGDQYDSNIPD